MGKFTRNRLIVWAFGFLAFSTGCNFSPSYTPKFLTPTDGEHFTSATTYISGKLILSLTPDEQKRIDAEMAKGAKGDLSWLDPAGTTYVDDQATKKDGFGFEYFSFPLKPGANKITAKYVGTFSSRETSITVYYDVPPMASFTNIPGAAPLSVQFDASKSSTVDGTITNYLWDFGDNSTGTGEKILHAFKKSGSYLVKLTVTNSAQLSASVTTTVTVSNPTTLTITSPVNGSTVQSQAVNFTGTITFPPAGAVISVSDVTSGSTVQAAIASNGTFNAKDLKLALGPNQITVKALQGTAVVTSTAVSVTAQLVATQTVSAAGGLISLPGTATVTIPANAFETNTNISVLQTLTPATQTLYTDSTEIFLSGSAVSYEVRVNTGTVSINDGINTQITLSVPDTYLSSLPTNYGVQAYVQFLEESDSESYDHFEIIDSTFDVNSKTLTLLVPDYAFTNVRTANQSYEAIILIGSTPTLPNPPMSGKMSHPKC